MLIGATLPNIASHGLYSFHQNVQSRICVRCSGISDRLDELVM
jgi:hypothetical protein